jgi:phosphoribosylglycinamide formyltransferase-1
MTLPPLPQLGGLSPKETTTPLRVVVLASGNGSNLQVMIDAMNAGVLPIKIVGVICNVKDAYALMRAAEAGIDTAIFSHILTGENAGKRMDIKTFERHAKFKLNQWQPDLIVLAGFMRVLSGDFINASPAPMINLHPSLLPAYKGLDTHARAIEAGERLHGCSVHVVTAELDAGQVLTQALLSIRTNDTAESLQARVQELEHQLLPWTILLIANGMIPQTALTSTGVEKGVTDAAITDSPMPTLPLRLWLDDQVLQTSV